MTIFRGAVWVAFIIAAGALAGAPWAALRGSAQAQSDARPVVRYATRSDSSPPLRALSPRPPLPAILGEIFQRPRKLLPNRLGSMELDTFDAAIQPAAAASGAPTSPNGFEGVGNVNGYLPPDPSGAMGPNHYVQMVNSAFAIYTRDGTRVYGPVNNNTLWNAFGGPCETRNDGDPIVLYDHLASRWIMSQFALPYYPLGPYYQCVAVSHTSDPTGSWHRYEFAVSQQKLNDYPKLGVWPDGYYMAINQFKCTIAGRCSWAGQGVVAFERSAMLAGAPARMVYFDLESVDGNLGGMLPADVDGPAPPAGTPNYFAQIDDDAWGYSGDQLQIWEFHANWSTPTASTFLKRVALPVRSFNANLCGYARNCIPQPGGAKVDAISDRLMFRLQYRNFGSYQTLVANHTVDANGLDRAGIRWYELRHTATGWSVFQQSTYAPPTDAHHRWMGSIAMNGIGDIALGFSKSSTTLSPSVFVAGRKETDAVDVLPMPEVTLVNGAGYQTHSSGRWGDYSQMSIDPVDDCTFWFTGEYYASVSLAAWRTIIGSVKLRDCGAPVSDTTAPTTAITSPADGATVSGTVVVAASAIDNVGVTRVEFYVDGTLRGQDATAPYEWSWDTTGAEGVRNLQTLAFDSAGNVGTSTPVAVTVNTAPVPPQISLSATGYKVKGVQKVDLTWSGARGTSVSVRRNGATIAASTANDGFYTDNINNKGGGSYQYQICEVDNPAICSNEATARF